jgi:nucleoside-diphosphate-sugar epimerase
VNEDRARATTAVVTGAGGWLGQNLVRALAPARDRVRCLVHEEAAAPLLAVVGPNVEVVVGDVRDVVAIDRLFEDVSEPTVFHTAAVIHPTEGTREFYDVNVGGTELLLDGARRGGARRFVHVSSNSPFGANASPHDRFTEASPYNPYLGYGRSKMEAELVVRRAHDRGDTGTVIVRAPWFYGPYQPERQTAFFRAIARGRFPLVGSGTQQRSMVYVDNLVQGLLRAESTESAAGRQYWIADARPYELSEILETVRTALRAEGVRTTERRPIRLPALVGSLAEAVDRALQERGRYVQAVHVLGELKDSIACDISAARADLGYEPQFELLGGMRASIRWCLDHGQRM